MVHDDAKDKEFELEMSWACQESKGLHQFVPKNLLEEAEQLAKAALQTDMDEDQTVKDFYKTFFHFIEALGIEGVFTSPFIVRHSTPFQVATKSSRVVKSG